MHKIALLLKDDYQLVSRYVVGKYIKDIIHFDENNISLLLDDGTVVKFLQFEDELIVDIEPAV